MDLIVGCGGWGYFNVPGDRLKAYARAFGFVETNSTFYRTPPLEQVRKWRKSVPPRFEFAVKCPRVLTHEEALRPTPKAVKAFAGARDICKALDARTLVLQTPPAFATAPADVKDLLGSVDRSGLTLVWEPRGPARDAYWGLAQDQGIVPCVDLACESPPYDTELVYARLFGTPAEKKGGMGDGTLKKVRSAAESSGAKKAVLTFHGSRMYKDAARFLVYARQLE